MVAVAGKVESAPKLDGRNMVMVLGPDKRAQQAAHTAEATAAPEAPAPEAAAPEAATPEQPEAPEET